MSDNENTYIKNEVQDETQLKSNHESITQEKEKVSLNWKPGEIVLDLYEVKRELGVGGFGKVFQVLHNNWKVELAVKVPKPDSFTNQTAKENFVNEAQTWVDLGLYPNIVCCYYVRTLGGVPAVFVEYVDAGSLSDWIKTGKLYEGSKEKALERILDFSIQFAWGIDYAHEMGLIHQDIKPANVMVTSDGTVKVTDFGLARARAMAGEKIKASDKDSVMMSSGGMTPAYCSPEQSSGDKISRKTDIWSFGISLLEMFTGEVTWMSGVAAPLVFENYIQHGTDNTAIPKIPEELKLLLKQCFESELDKRPASMNDVSEELGRIYLHVTGHNYKREKPSHLELRADALNNKGAAYLDLGRQKEAEQCFEEAVKVDPKHLQGLFNKGYLQWQQAQLSGSEFIKTIRDLEEEQGNTPEYRTLLSWLLLEQGNIDELSKIQSKENGVNDEQFLKALSLEDNPRIRELHRLSGHERAIDSICFSPDNSYIASGNRDGDIVYWDAKNGKKLKSFGRHDLLKTLCFSSDGKTLLSAGGYTIILWNVESGSDVRSFTCQNENMELARLFEDGRYIVTIGSKPGKDANSTITLCDVQSGKILQCFEDQSWSVTFSRGIDINFTVQGSILIAGTRGSGFDIELWDATKKKTLLFFKGHTNYMSAVCFSSDGHKLLSGSYDNTVRLWDVKSGRQIRCFRGHAAEVTSLCFTPDKKHVVSGSSDNTVRIWDIESARELRCIECHTNNVNSVCLSPNGHYILSAGYDSFMGLHEFYPGCDSYRVFHPFPVLKKPKSVKVFSALEVEYRKQIQYAKDLVNQGKYKKAIAPLSQLLSIEDYKRDRDVWMLFNLCGKSIGKCKGLKDIALRHLLKEHTGWLSSICFSPDIHLIASGSRDTSILLWDVERGRLIRHLKGHEKDVTSVCFSPDCRFVLSGSLDSTVRLWDVNSGNELRQFKGHTDSVYSVCFSPDGRFALSGSGDYAYKVDNTIRLWDVDSGREIHCFKGHERDVQSVCFSSDGASVFSGSLDGTIRLWDVKSGKEINLFPFGDRAFFIAANGMFAVSTSYRENEILLWDMKKNKLIRTLRGHTDSIGSVCISPDNLFILSGSDDHTVRIWEFNSGKEVRCISSHENSVNSVSFSSDGRYILSGSSDFTIRLWEIFLDWKF